MRERLPDNVQMLSGLRPDDPGYSIADEAVVAALSAAELQHFWFRARNHVIATELTRLGVPARATLLELGCGGGAVATHLAGLGYAVTGVDGHLPRVREAAARTPDARFIVHDLSRGLDELPRGFDSIGFFDVIEHLDDPAGALRAAKALVRDEGWIVGTVPALQALWSEVDALAGHKCRYDVRSMRQLLAQSGLEVVRTTYFNRALVPPMYLRRRKRVAAAAAQVADLAVPPPIVNRVLEAVLRVEHAIMTALRLGHVPGASLFFAARVPRHGRRSGVPLTGATPER